MAGTRVVHHSADRARAGVGTEALARLVSRAAVERPGYRASAGGIRTLLLDGRVPLRTWLPAERELAGALASSRATVTAAYDLLREGGYAVSRRGASTWTTLPEGHRPANVAAFPVGGDSDSGEGGDDSRNGTFDLTVPAPEAPEGELLDAYAEAGRALPRYAATPS